MGTRAPSALRQRDPVSTSKLCIDVHLRVPGEVADRLDELMTVQKYASRNALIMALLDDGLARRNHAVIQSRYRARRKIAKGVG